MEQCARRGMVTRRPEIWFTGTRSGASQALYAVTRSGDERLLLRAPAALTLHDVSSDEGRW